MTAGNLENSISDKPANNRKMNTVGALCIAGISTAIMTYAFLMPTNNLTLSKKTVKIGEMEFIVKPFEKGYEIQTILNNTLLRAIDEDGDDSVDVSLKYYPQDNPVPEVEQYNLITPDWKVKMNPVPREVQSSFSTVMKEYRRKD